MFDKFGEYMFYLLNTPLKTGKKKSNQFYIFLKIIGKLFDETKNDILRIREESIIMTASLPMLQIHALDRTMQLYEGEEIENFRTRLSMKAIVAEWAGTKEGVLLAVKSLGYSEVAVIPCYLTEAERWAEFYITIRIDIDIKNLVAFPILKKAVREVKQASAKDNYRFQYVTKTDITNQEWIEPRSINRMNSNWWGTTLCFDGMIVFDGSYSFNADIVKTQTRFTIRYEMANVMNSSVSIKSIWSVDADIEKTITKTINRIIFSLNNRRTESKMTYRFLNENICNESVIQIITKNNLWYFNGEYNFNGKMNADAYVKEEMI